MFWGVTLESGKHYSQKVSESYHLSMAALGFEGDTKPLNKHVYVMIKHKEKEYVLCVLEYGRVMQTHLDIIFDSGEVVTYFLKGEGTVHLTGYALAETDDASDSLDQTEEVSGLTLDDDEEDEDWTPAKDEEIVSDEESEESEEGDSDTGSEPVLMSPRVVEINEDDDTDDAHETQRREKVKVSKSKKRKMNDSSLIQNGTAEGEKSKSKKQRKMDMNHVNAEDSDASLSTGEESDDASNEDYDSSDDDYNSEEEQKISSAGRTPLPKNKVSSRTSLGESPELRLTPRNSPQSHQKTKFNKGNVSSPNKGTVPVTLKNVKKLEGDVQIEDIRIGSGPTAKKGKLVYLHYVGQFTNGKVFEACEFPKKPFSFRLGKGEVIRGLEVGIEGMTVGSKRKITIPPNMGYGSRKGDLVPPNSTLMFTVELKAVNQ